MSLDQQSQLRKLAQFWLAQRGHGDLDIPENWLGELQREQLPEGSFLVRQGDVGDTLYYIESGLVRLFYLTPDGKERNKAFYHAGQITGPVSAALSDSAAPFSIQCLERTTLIGFHYRDFATAARYNADLSRLYIELLEEAFIRNERREAVLLTCNAQQRYEWLCANEPELLERVPQFHLASYLGLDPVSLSRLKGKVIK